MFVSLLHQQFPRVVESSVPINVPITVLLELSYEDGHLEDVLSLTSFIGGSWTLILSHFQSPDVTIDDTMRTTTGFTRSRVTFKDPSPRSDGYMMPSSRRQAEQAYGEDTMRSTWGSDFATTFEVRSILNNELSWRRCAVGKNIFQRILSVDRNSCVAQYKHFNLKFSDNTEYFVIQKHCSIISIK